MKSVPYFKLNQYSKNSNGSAEILEENNYYPFGLNHTGGNGINNSGFGSWLSYKFNGKELQETGMYDFGVRMYLSDLGRWGVIDPLAEQMRRYSPYNFAFNNPVSFIDPDGMAPKQFAMPGDSRPDVYSEGNNSNWLGLGNSGGNYGQLETSIGGGGNIYQTDEGTVYTGNAIEDALKALTVSNSYDFSQFHFSKSSLDDPTPKRKYLKNESIFNIWGIETRKIQYQLDNVNMNLEFKQIIKQIGELTDKVDSAMDWTPGISGSKGVYDFIKEGAKALNPSTLIFVLGSTTIMIESANAKNFLEMYQDVRSNYDDMHAKFPVNMKGITVNVDMIVGPQNHIWSRYSFYDISTHRYLGGRTFE